MWSFVKHATNALPNFPTRLPRGGRAARCVFVVFVITWIGSCSPPIDPVTQASELARAGQTEEALNLLREAVEAKKAVWAANTEEELTKFRAIDRELGIPHEEDPAAPELGREPGLAGVQAFGLKAVLLLLSRPKIS